MSIKRLAKKPFLKLFAIAVIGGNALAGCIEQSQQRHVQPVQVVNQVSLSKSEETQIKNFVNAIDAGDIVDTEEVDFLVSRATHAIDTTSNPSIRKFLRSVIVTGNQLLEFDRRIASLQDDLVTVDHGHASPEYLNHQVFPKIQSFTDSYQGNTSLMGAVVNNVKKLEELDFRFPLLRHQLIDLRNSLEAEDYNEGFSQIENGNNFFMAFNDQTKKLQTVITQYLRKL